MGKGRRSVAERSLIPNRRGLVLFLGFSRDVRVLERARSLRG